MNTKKLVDLIFGLIFTVFVLLILLSVIVLEEKQVTDEDLLTGELTEVVSPDQADPEILAGKALFKNNCGRCHNKNMKDPMIGPALANVTERWAAFPEDDLYRWIRNAPALIAEKHPKAVAVHAKYKGNMDAFPNFEDKDIAAILRYIEESSN